MKGDNICYECGLPVEDDDEYVIVGVNKLHCSCYDKYAGDGSFRRFKGKMREWRQHKEFIQRKKAWGIKNENERIDYRI